LPELESGLGADQELADSELELRKVADSLPVIFDSDFESALTLCRSGGGGSETKSQNERQDSPGESIHYRVEDSSDAISLRVSFFPTGSRGHRPTDSALMATNAQL
jgi:hypothetical protein